MTKRDLKAHAWDLHDLGTIGPGNPQWDQVVAEMEKDGYRPLWGDVSATHYNTVAVAVFERKPPSLLDDVKRAFRVLGASPRHDDVLWSDARLQARAILQLAIAREEARGE